MVLLRPQKQAKGGSRRSRRNVPQSSPFDCRTSSFQSALSIVTQKYNAGAPLPWFEIDKTPMLWRKTPLEGASYVKRSCAEMRPLFGSNIIPPRIFIHSRCRYARKDDRGTHDKG